MNSFNIDDEHQPGHHLFALTHLTLMLNITS